MFRYYQVERPFGPGNQPELEGMGLHAFPEPHYVRVIGQRAYGYLDCPPPLPSAEVRRYGLVPLPCRLDWHWDPHDRTDAGTITRRMSLERAVRMVIRDRPMVLDGFLINYVHLPPLVEHETKAYVAMGWEVLDWNEVGSWYHATPLWNAYAQELELAMRPHVREVL